jgi:hypothetical protein
MEDWDYPFAESLRSAIEQQHAMGGVGERPRRDVRALTLGELARSSHDMPHRKRVLVIEGVEIVETLEQRLVREAEELEEAIEALAGKLARRRKQIAQVQRYPKTDPFEDGQTIEFDKVFPGTPERPYPYSARRAEGLWYVTGARSPQGVSWVEFIEWLGVGVEQIYAFKGGRRVKVLN